MTECNGAALPTIPSEESPYNMVHFVEKLSRKEIACALLTRFEVPHITRQNIVEVIAYIHTELFTYTHPDENPSFCGEWNDSAESMDPVPADSAMQPPRHRMTNKRFFKACETLAHDLYGEKPASHFLAEFSYHFLAANVFTYGNSLTLRYFLHILGRDYPQHFPYGIDFRRLTGEDIRLISHEVDASEKLIEVFEHSLNPDYDPKHFDEEDLWSDLDDASITVGKERFLSYKSEGETPYLVAINGGLVKLETIQQDIEYHLKNNETWFCVSRELFSGNLMDEEPDYVDGIDVSGDTVPLLHLDRDYLRLVPQSRLQSIINDIFKDVVAAKHTPSFYMTMGGSGSGKSGLLDIAKKELNDQELVTASLDDARTYSQLYPLYLKASHHNDDYKSLTQFAKTIRNRIMEHALKFGYNLFYDGSGVEYKGQYNKIISRFKKAGYRTNILAASAPLIIEKDRGDISYPVIRRLEKRANKEENARGVPWDIAIEKHIGYARSKLDAARDWNVDRLTVEDRGGEKGEQYMVEQLYMCDVKTYNDLCAAKELGGHPFLHKLTELGLIEKNMNEQFAQTIDMTLCALEEDKVRLLITLDKIRTLDGLQKGALNAKAFGEQDLLFNTHPYHIPAIDYPLDVREKEEKYYPNRLRHTTEHSNRWIPHNL